MKIVFLGTPEWAVPSLDELAARPGVEIAAVVTNPDKPVGRRGRQQAPPVKSAAARHGLTVHQPQSARDGELASILRAAAPEVAVVVAYGKILPPDVLQQARLGFLNLHFSLLPTYRGAAPVQRALMDGVKSTGVSVMLLTEGMDEGPVLANHEVSVDPDEVAGELGARLAKAGGPLLADCLLAYAEGRLAPEPQDDRRATYAPKITIDEARIDWNGPADRVHNLVRATNPEPGAWTELRGERVKVLRTAIDSSSALEPAQLVLTKQSLKAGTGTGLVEIVEAQRAGGKKMGGAELARGLRLTSQDHFV